MEKYKITDRSSLGALYKYKFQKSTSFAILVQSPQCPACGWAERLAECPNWVSRGLSAIPGAQEMQAQKILSPKQNGLTFLQRWQNRC